MSPRNRPLDPDQLSQVVAEKLATEPAPKRRWLRGSVLLGRVINGAGLALLILALSFPVFAAVSWMRDLLGQDLVTTSSPLGAEDQAEVNDLTGFLSSALQLGDGAGPQLTLPGVEVLTSTTTTLVGSDDSSTSTSGGPTTSTIPGETTTTAAASTTSSSSANTTTTTVGATTTTSQATTTTTMATTSTSCGNQSGNGNGKGRGGGNC